MRSHHLLMFLNLFHGAYFLTLLSRQHFVSAFLPLQLSHFSFLFPSTSLYFFPTASQDHLIRNITDKLLFLEYFLQSS